MLETMGMLVERYYGLFLDGVKYTLLLAFIAVTLGTVIGTLLAIMKMAKFKPISWLATAYIEIFRGTPLLLQLYLFYFLVPQIMPFEPSKFVCVSTALVLNTGAYVSEIIRAGIQAVDKGQTEAARSLGMTNIQTMIYVVLPQVCKRVLLPVSNEVITLVKDTSLAFTLAYQEVFSMAKQISASQTSFMPFLIAGVFYFVANYVVEVVMARIEKSMDYYK